MQDPKSILPAAALVALFKDSLVLPEKEIKSSENEEKAMHTAIGKVAIASLPSKEVVNELKAVPAEPLKYLGEHLKGIVVLVHDVNAVHLNETDLGLLSSILNACKLNLADIALVNTATQPLSLHEILTTLPSQLVLAFDLSSAQLKLKLPTSLYKPLVLGETHILFSNSLQSMQGADQNAKIEKSKLWNALKLLFKL
ncbi:MAG: hypothetical protein RLZ56_342 [Bacteroidota bacterium]|jgi:hypothetical protein